MKLTLSFVKNTLFKLLNATNATVKMTLVVKDSAQWEEVFESNVVKESHTVLYDQVKLPIILYGIDYFHHLSLLCYYW